MQASGGRVHPNEETHFTQVTAKCGWRFATCLRHHRHAILDIPLGNLPVRTVVQCFILTFLTLFVSSSQEMRTLGLKGGVNLSAYGSPYDRGARSWVTNFSIGGFAEWRLSHQLAIEPDIFYTVRGTESFIDEAFTKKQNGSLFSENLVNLEVPVLVKYYLPYERPYVDLSLGPSLNCLMNAYAHFNNLFTGKKNVLNGSVRSDFGVIAGGEVSVSTPIALLILDLRYDFGLTSIQSANGKVHDQVIAILAGIGF